MRFLNTNKKKNLLVFLFAFFVVSVSFVIFPGVVSADHSEVHNNLLNKTGCTGFFDASGGCLMSAAGDIAGVVAAPFIYAFKLILLGIFTLLGWVASVAVTLFEWVIKPENIAGPNGLLNLPSVYQMWQFVRDFFNIFFIFVLLYIAFTTVFQIQKNFKKAILSLVLAALFVNFSYPIARVLIDVTNVPMYFFANQMMASNGKSPGEGGVFSTAMTASHIQGILIPSDIGILTAGKIDFAQYFVAIIYMFLFAVTLLVLAVMFVIRLVALVILVIFSSAGFVAFIVPGMEKYGKMWWDNFWKYALFGPAAMLMLLVATRFFDELDNVNTGIFKGLKDTSSGLVGGDPTLIASMAMFSIPIIMLWMAIGLGQKMGLAGAATISGKGEKFAKWAGKTVTKTPALWAGRKLDSKLAEGRVTKYLSPGAWREAFKKRSEEQKHKDKEPIELAGSTMQDQLNAGFSRVANTILPTSWKAGKFMANTDHTDHRFDTRQKQKNAKVKEITEVSDRSDVVIGKMEHAVSGKDMSEAEAALGVLIKNNDLNDMIVAVGHKYGGTNEVSSENAKLVLANILRQSGVTDEEDIAKTLMVLSDQAMASGNYAFGGMSHYNPANHTFSISTPAQQAAQVAGKFNNLEPQKQAQMLHPDALFKRDAAGFTDMNDDIATAIIPNISKATSDQSNRSRSDMRTALQNAWEEVTVHGRAADFPNFVANYNDPANSNFRYYIGKMLEQNSALPAGITAATMPATI